MALLNLRVALAILGGFILAGQVHAKPMSRILNLISVNNKSEMRRAVCMDAGATLKLLIAKIVVVMNVENVNPVKL